MAYAGGRGYEWDFVPPTGPPEEEGVLCNYML